MKIKPSEAIFMFCGWLTTREEKTIMSASDECSDIVKKIELFCKANNLEEPDNDFANKLVHPKE